VLALGALAFGAAPAHASIYFASELVEAPDGAGSFGQVDCAPGDGAVSAGFDSGAPLADRVYLLDMFPITNSPPNGWNVAAQNFAGGAVTNSPVISVACDDETEPGDLKPRYGQGGTIPDGRQKTSKVACKPGEIVVGGGGAVSAPSVRLGGLSSSAPYDGPDRNRRPDGWRVKVRNDVDSAGREIGGEPYVMCDRERSSKDVRYATAARSIGDDDLGDLEAECDDGQIVIGGGIDVSAPFARHAHITRTIRNEFSGDSWLATVENYDTPDDEDVKAKATAICLDV